MMVSPDNAPRDLEQLKALSRPVKYRLALSLNICQPKSAEEQAFVTSAEDVQAQTLLSALQLRDANGQQPPPQLQQAAPVQQAAPQQMQAPPPVAQPVGQVVPQPLQPQMQAPAPAAVSPAPMQPQPQQAPAPMQQPQMATPGQPPGPATAATVQQPQAAPAPLQQPGPVQPGPAPLQQPQAIQQPPPQPPPQRQPMTQSDPSNAGAAGAGGNVLGQILAELQTCAGVAEVEELKDAILGMIRIQRIQTLLLLEIAEGVLGVDKKTLIGMTAAASKSGEVEALLSDAIPEGKG